MQIYVLRHGVAEDAGPGQPDSDRRLTQKGKDKLRKVLKRAGAAGAAPEVILSSPYRRAAESAAIAREELGLKDEIIAAKVLEPSSSAVEIWQEIRNYGHAGQIMVVGHNPLLTEFVCFLTGAPAYAVALKKGALALVEVQGLSPTPRGTLAWLLTAKTAGA